MRVGTRALACLAVAALAGATAADAGSAPPAITGAVATTYNDVRVQFNEPVDPASVQPGDFALQMAAVNRRVDRATVTGDGSIVMVHSPNTWMPGQAGMLNLTAPGVVSSTSGQQSTSTDQVHVGGAPGDFVPPHLSHFSISPSRGVCFSPGHGCRRLGTTVTFTSSEDGFYYLTAFRGSRNFGSVKHLLQPGDNFLRFDGKEGGRRLPRGRFRIVLSGVDTFGNVTPANGDPKAALTVR
jgi:hypothetical protein